MPSPDPALPPDILDLDDYARFAARVAHAAGRPAPEVVVELGLDAGRWHASATTWESAMDDGLARGDRRLFNAFIARFAAERAALGRRPAPSPSAAPAPSSPRPPPPAPLHSSPPPPLPCSVPPPLLAPSPPLLAPPPASSLAAPPSSGVPIPSVPNVPIDPTTAMIDGRRASQPVLPFSTPPEPSSLVLGPDTARIDTRGMPSLPAPPPRASEDDEPAALPLVLVKRRARGGRWLAWLRRWLDRAHAQR